MKNEGKKMKIISWNVNGLRACVTKGFIDFFKEVQADIFCVQETKLQSGQIELELEEAVRLMNEATKERKIHEKLKDNQFEVFLQELNQEEMKEIDQLVSYQYNKNADEEE